MYCPACGETIENDDRFADFIVCPWCHDAIEMGADGVRVAGHMGALAATTSPLQVGTTGTVLGRSFTVLGRVRYTCADGTWDEWFVGFMDGSRAWISEDEGNLTFETSSESETAPLEFARASLGDTVVLGNTQFYVQEKDVARCEGGEGQLPFEVEAGEEVPYLDLAAEGALATIEYDEDGLIRIFIGRPIDLSDLDLDLRADPPPAPEVAEPLKPHTSAGRRPWVPFEIGQAWALRGRRGTLLGHIRYREREEGRTYLSDDFLLQDEAGAYFWLGLERGHFTFVEPLERGPGSVRYKTIRPKTAFRFGGRTYKAFERGRAEIVWVEGKFPWRAKVGDPQRFMDAISPPYMLSAEWTDTELEWSRGTYIPRSEIVKGFQLGERTLKAQRGVAPHQPYANAFRRLALFVMLAAAFLNVVLAILSAGDDGKQIARFSLDAEDYTEGFLTEPFEIKEAPNLCLAKFAAPVDNEWVYVDVALVDAKDRALVEFSAQVAYYHGYEGGESWTEGSTDDEVVFHVVEPGTYRLLLKGETAWEGGWATSAPSFSNFTIPGSRASNKSKPALTVAISEGCGLARWHLILAGAFLLWFIVEGALWLGFEARRWEESDA